MKCVSPSTVPAPLIIMLVKQAVAAAVAGWWCEAHMVIAHDAVSTAAVLTLTHMLHEAMYWQDLLQCRVTKGHTPSALLPQLNYITYFLLMMLYKFIYLFSCH